MARSNLINSTAWQVR